MTVTIYQAKTHLSRILQQVELGEEVVVCRGKQPIARIIPSASTQTKRPKVEPVRKELVFAVGHFARPHFFTQA